MLDAAMITASAVLFGATVGALLNAGLTTRRERWNLRRELFTRLLEGQGQVKGKGAFGVVETAGGIFFVVANAGRNFQPLTVADGTFPHQGRVGPFDPGGLGFLG